MNKVLYLVAFIMIFSMSCRKSNNNSDLFPTETQEGKNTIGCYIEGNSFIGGTTLFGLVSQLNVTYFKDSTAYSGAGQLSINGIDARYYLDNAGDIVINKFRVFGTGEYSLTHVRNCGTINSCDDIGYRNAKTGKTYFAESGKLTISKLDTLNKIVSGTFSFIAKDSAGLIIKVTNGRFDAKIKN